VNGSDLTSATVSGNVVVRGGGNAFLEQQPALHIGKASDGQRVGIVSNAVVSNNTIRDSTYDSIDFSTSTGTQLQNNLITNPGRDGIAVGPPHFEATSGDATITGNTVTGVKAGRSAFISYSTAFNASVSGNSWQGATATATATARATATATPTPTPTPATQGPFGGSNRALASGATIQAEDYDVGGPGVAYNDTTAGNTGGGYRTDDVDIEACGDTGGGWNVGWIVDGEWLEYTVNATSGTYTITARVASAGATVGDLQVSLDGVVLGTIAVNNTGGWQTYVDASITGVAITGGNNKVLRLQSVNGGDFNVNYIRFATAGTAGTQSFDATSGVMAVDYAGYLSKHDVVVYNSANTNPAYGLTVGNGRGAHRAPTGQLRGADADRQRQSGTKSLSGTSSRLGQ